MSEDQAIAIMVFLRQHIEQGSLKEYEITKFYCNWTLHVSLDRKPVENILDDIFKVLDDESRNLNDRVCEILEMKALRSEINEILRNENVITPVFDSQKIWKQFVFRLLGLVLEKPLRRNKQIESSHVAELTLVAPNINELDEHYIKELNLKDGVVFWRIMCLPEEEIYKGPLTFTEFAHDFKHP